MNASKGPAHVVVDGSNLATEGRSMPSLKQLSEAVMSFMEENPDTEITVVVDATFGHRIDKKESKEFEEGISNNELVAPPAGAVGRGDAFVLGIADKAGSTVLSNDSFQEFHGDYDWLFDEGRLIGGKPVPHVGWVWVARTPVRGPVSRKATRGSGSSGVGSGRGRGGRSRGRQQEEEGTARVGSPEANAPMPVPKSPPPSAKKQVAKQAEPKQQQQERRPSRGGDPVNELLPFLEFVEHHPVGTSVTGVVDSYSSHGAYIVIGDDARGYIPLRMMAEPTPRSAKSIMKVGDSVTAIVVSFNGSRRSIDCALPDMAEAAITEAEADQVREDAEEIDGAASPEAAPAKQTSNRRTAAVKKTPAKKAVAKKVPAKKVPAKKVPAKKVPAKKAGAKKTAAKQAATPSAGTVERIPAKKTPIKQAPAKQVPAKKTAAKKTAAKKAAAKQVPAKKTAAKKAAAKQASAKKVPAKKTAAKQAAAKQVSAKKVPAKKKAAAKKATAKKES